MLKHSRGGHRAPTHLTTASFVRLNKYLPPTCKTELWNWFFMHIFLCTYVAACTTSCANIAGWSWRKGRKDIGGSPGYFGSPMSSYILWESSEPKPAIQNCNSIIYREVEDSRCCWYLTHRQDKHHSHIFAFEHQVEETSWKMYGWQSQVTFNNKLRFKQLNGKFECKGERTWVEIPGTWRIRFAIHHPWTCAVG